MTVNNGKTEADIVSHFPGNQGLESPQSPSKLSLSPCHEQGYWTLGEG